LIFAITVVFVGTTIRKYEYTGRFSVSRGASM
jgi:hypothetical protein